MTAKDVDRIDNSEMPAFPALRKEQGLEWVGRFSIRIRICMTDHLVYKALVFLALFNELNTFFIENVEELSILFIKYNVTNITHLKQSLQYSLIYINSKLAC